MSAGTATSTTSSSISREHGSMDTNDSETLFQRLGGAPTVRKVIDRLYERLLKDDRLAVFFTGVRVWKLRAHQFQFMQLALTRIPPAGDDMDVPRFLFEKHRRLIEQDGMGMHHFDYMAEHFVEVLQELQVPAALIEEVADIILPLRTVFDKDFGKDTAPDVAATTTTVKACVAAPDTTATTPTLMTTLSSSVSTSEEALPPALESDGVDIDDDALSQQQQQQPKELDDEPSSAPSKDHGEEAIENLVVAANEDQIKNNRDADDDADDVDDTVSSPDTPNADDNADAPNHPDDSNEICSRQQRRQPLPS